MKEGIKYLFPVFQSAVYILITGIVKHKWYQAFISAPAIALTIGLVVFVRIKLEIAPRGSKLTYYILCMLMAHIMCLLII